MSNIKFLMTRIMKVGHKGFLLLIILLFSFLSSNVSQILKEFFKKLIEFKLLIAIKKFILEVTLHFTE